MRFNELDLNLLIALDALIDEQSVSSAADRVHLSQSAMSGALARLRQALGDDLLVPRGRGMVLTPRAVELAASVKEILTLVERNVLTKPGFDPATSARAIPIMASDFAVSVGLAPALREIQHAAPRIRFEILPMSSDPFGQLDRDEIKLLVIPEVYASPEHSRRALFEDRYVCVGWRDNPHLTGGTISREALAALPHVAVEFERQRAPSAVQWVHERLGRALQRAITVANYGSVPFLLVGTERISLMHARMAGMFAALLPLSIVELPVEIPRIVEVIQWRGANDADEGLMWVVDMIATLAPGLTDQA